MAFPFLTIFILFLLFLFYRYRKLSQQTSDSKESFWERELRANATPAKDISNLPYITIPLDKFPMDSSDNPEILEIEQKLRELSTQRILNLTGVTNTQLKEQYGVPNLAEMSMIGERFDELSTLLVAYAEALISEGKKAAAVSVLEFGAGIHTDVSRNYTLLADCYYELGQSRKLGYLREQIEVSDLILKPSILRHLDSLGNSTIS